MCALQLTIGLTMTAGLAQLVYNIIHGSSGAAIVIIGDCKLTYPVSSLIDGPNNSKALKVHTSTVNCHIM